MKFPQQKHSNNIDALLRNVADQVKQRHGHRACISTTMQCRNKLYECSSVTTKFNILTCCIALSGSREKYKWVMQYDNFEFVSTRWSLQQHWFVKIDTWLDGICKPAHPKLWAAKHAAGERAKFATDSSTTHDNGWDATKFSIFAADSEGDEHTEGSSAVQQDDVLSV